MKKLLFTLLFFFAIFTSWAQQFLQYQTGTLYDSFENPAQRAFIPDSSRQFSFNFLIPNLGSSGNIIGNGQTSIQSLINKGVYNSSGLVSGLHNNTILNVGANQYWFMLKMYNRLNGDQEFGVSAQTKAEGRGLVTDETLLLLDSYRNFNNGTENNNLFNNTLQGQAYHQLSLTIRQKFSSNLALGIKLSTLLGIYYNKLAIDQSSFLVQNNAMQAQLGLQGQYRSSFVETYPKRALLGLRNPGAAISFGLQSQLENGLLLQGNIKDLGFIRWGGSAITYDFNGTIPVKNIATTSNNSSRILTETDNLITKTGSNYAFYAPIDGKAEVAVSKKYSFFTDDFSYSPVLIVSKHLFYNGISAALVNHFTFKNLWFTALASYNNDRVWNAGAQIMIKSPNAEFFIGTEQLFKSARFFNQSKTVYNSSGINAFLGFSAKFGHFIEHPANASYIPMGNERGFFNRMWLRIFKQPRY